MGLVHVQIGSGGGRIGEDVIKAFTHGRDHRGIPIKEIKFRPNLAGALVVGMIPMTAIRRHPPVVGLAARPHGVTVFGIARNSRQRHDAHVARRLNPVRLAGDG